MEENNEEQNLESEFVCHGLNYCAMNLKNYDLVKILINFAQFWWASRLGLTFTAFCYY